MDSCLRRNDGGVEGVGGELEVVDLFVDASGGEEFGVGAALGEAALVKDED